jgi:hypothetical protein
MNFLSVNKFGFGRECILVRALTLALSQGTGRGDESNTAREDKRGKRWLIGENYGGN